MQLHTYRARTIQEALRLVREDLGSDASVLHTREVASPLGRWLGSKLIEVTASIELEAPSRLERVAADEGDDSEVLETRIPAADLQNYKQQFLHDLLVRNQHESSLVEQLASASRHGNDDLPAVAKLRGRLRRLSVSDRLAGPWLARLAAELACDPDCHPDRAADRLRHIVAAELVVGGPIDVQPGRAKVVALVGPTGVGKTTTLAKLAAYFRVIQRCSVALITCDTYRIAAADQLRTYAQIMDLPMEVVSTPAEMLAACERLGGHDLVLVDTAGRSPRDAARLQELRALLAVAQPDSIQLVQSCVADEQSLSAASQAFASVGASGMILTKLDEAAEAGRIATGLFASRLPLSYTTHGQNVPDDIHPASAVQLAELILPLT